MNPLVILGDIGIKTATKLVKSVKISHIKACHPLVFHGTEPTLHLGLLSWRIRLVIMNCRPDTRGKQIHLFILIGTAIIEVE